MALSKAIILLRSAAAPSKMTYYPAVFGLFFFFSCGLVACVPCTALRSQEQQKRLSPCCLMSPPPPPLFPPPPSLWRRHVHVSLSHVTFYCEISAVASLVDTRNNPTLTVCWPLSDPGYNPSEITSALIIDSPFYYIQNEDVSNQDSETEQAGEGSACPRGPHGPAGPPGIEVGSKIFSCSRAHHTHTACNVSVAQPPWFLSAAHLPPSALKEPRWGQMLISTTI